VKILIVDDSETLRTQLRRDLESKKYAVIEGTDGVDGLAKIGENSDVRMVITDVNMPKMDGLAMAKKIHELPNFQKLPIIVMTTELAQDLKNKGKEAGVLAWVTKPYNAEKLLAVVGKVLA
jgi:two-component system, chemotaxis family, chemotaxis protein CheY